MADEFVWNVVMDKIAALENQGVLMGTGIRMRAAWPTPTEECQTPIIFPARDPTIGGLSISLNTFSGHARPTDRGSHKTAVYTINWVYLHAELTQAVVDKGTQQQHEPKLLSNLSRLFDEIAARHANLGVVEVLPVEASIDGDFVSPVTGKSYMGARIAVRCTEYIHFRH